MKPRRLPCPPWAWTQTKRCVTHPLKVCFVAVLHSVGEISLSVQIFLQRFVFQLRFICSCLKLNWTTYQGNCAQVPQPLSSSPPPRWHIVQRIQAYRDRWVSLSIISRHYCFFLSIQPYQTSKALKYFNACRYAHYHKCVYYQLHTLKNYHIA